ncbi:MAG: sigma 54-interacting transcriptional regulator [Planctomycetes bacterium]|nr:sigma 54-interacting transcriptional regulator [Planctomycetota bacterium]
MSASRPEPAPEKTPGDSVPGGGAALTRARAELIRARAEVDGAESAGASAASAADGIVDVEGRVVAEIPELQRAYDRGIFHGLVGTSSAMRRVFEKIVLYGRADSHVLITGETGTGKELVARALHLESPRAAKPFVALNCSSLNEELFESELFGHEKGSFTGAMRTHRGRFERAEGGSLFLDEIGDMPLRMQTKLLRVLEEEVFERVGGEVELPIDVRIFAATNVSLGRAIELGAFRADLYHRVAVLPIKVPPLRERLEDLTALVAHFLEALNRRYRRHVRALTPEALRLLEEYHWPGNVRELRNVLERVYVETPGEVIGARSLGEWVRERDAFAAGAWNVHSLLERERPAVWNLPMQGGRGPAPAGLLPSPSMPPPREEHVLDAEARVVEPGRAAEAARAAQRSSRRPHHLDPEQIRDAMRRANGNATHAAELLGCHKTTLYRALLRYGIAPEALRDEEQRS